MPRSLDLISIGRCSVDLYGGQVGGRLEDMRSFDKYVGGSPTNMAVGTARLGLRSALITRVGDEHMGRFLREELEREGVETAGIVTDPERLTALVILGIRDHERFPLIFYRENCADMALSEEDIDPDFVAGARAVVATGTHLSHPRTAAAVLKALRIAREAGSRTALDIDYRPNLWGLSGHGDGENRFIASDKVTARLQSTLPLFQLIVGTEEEFHIAGGSTDTIAALRAVRAVSDAALVCKRGPMGAAAFLGEIPDRLDDGIAGPGFPVEVFNVLGAGDGFMSGLLRGWIRGEPWETALTWANACGAFAVSRHGCAPAYPSWTELQTFLAQGVRRPALRTDRGLEQLHWSTTRAPAPDDLRILAFDDRALPDDLYGATTKMIGAFKACCLAACRAVAAGRLGHGLLCDGRSGRAALHSAAGQGLWIGRPVDQPGLRPLSPEPSIGPDFGGLAEWPREHVVTATLCNHADDQTLTQAAQDDFVTRLFHAARRNRLELLLEVVPPKGSPLNAVAAAQAIRGVYRCGVYPDWWMLGPAASGDGWRQICAAVTDNDAHSRGILVRSDGQTDEALVESFRLAAAQPLVKGFVAGRTVFAEAAEAFFAGTIDGSAATAMLEARYRSACAAWDAARTAATGAAGSRAARPGGTR